MHFLHMNTFLLIRQNVRQTGQFEALIPPIILECCAALNKPTLEPPYEPFAVNTNNIAQREGPHSHSLSWEIFLYRHSDHATAGSGPLPWLNVC